jgi:ferredoxin-NADP reductase
VKSFTLVANGHFRGFRAGQHVNLTVEIDGVRYTRCYSPSNAPDGKRTVVLTVKRHRGGRVSEWLHERLRVGEWVELSQAFGDFTLPEIGSEKLLFIAGGSGITPIASLARELVRDRSAREVTLLVYARTEPELIFGEELRRLSKEDGSLRVHVVLTRDDAQGTLRGRFSSEHLAQVVPDVAQRQTFACGPRTLIDAVQALWSERGWALPKLETFTPLAPMPTDEVNDSRVVAVTAKTTGRTFAASPNASLLVQAEQAGLSPVSGCRQGICFSCTCLKRSGSVRNLSSGAISSEPNEEIRLCVSAPLSDVTLDL